MKSLLDRIHEAVEFYGTTAGEGEGWMPAAEAAASLAQHTKGASNHNLSDWESACRHWKGPVKWVENGENADILLGKRGNLLYYRKGGRWIADQTANSEAEAIADAME